VVPDFGRELLQELLKFMHGLPSCAIPAAAVAFLAHVATVKPAGSKAATKTASERNIKATCTKDNTLPGAPAKSKAKYWGVNESAWALAGLPPAPLVPRDVPKPERTKPKGAAAGTPSASGPAEGAGAAAPPSPPAAVSTPPAVAGTPSRPPVGGGAAPSPGGAPQPPDARAISAAAVLREALVTALTGYCAYVAEGGEGGAEGGGALVGPASVLQLQRGAVLGNYAGDAHTQSLLMAYHADTGAASAAAYPEAHVPLLALLAQGSSAPLSALSTAISAVLMGESGIAPSAFSVSDRLLLIAARTAHGIVVRGVASAEAEGACEAAWRWEVVNLEHLALPLAAGEEGEAGGEGAEGAAGAGAPKKARADPASRRIITAVKDERHALKLLGDKVKAAARVIEVTSPATSGGKGRAKPGVVDEVKATEAGEKLLKAARAWEAVREKEAAEVARRAVREAERSVKETRAREEKEAKAATRAAEKEARESEKAAAAAAEKEAKDKLKEKEAAHAAKFFNNMFKAAAPVGAASSSAARPAAAAVASKAGPAAASPATAPASLPASTSAWDGVMGAALDAPPSPQSSLDLQAWAEGSRTRQAAIRATRATWRLARRSGLGSSRPSASAGADAGYAGAAFVDLTGEEEGAPDSDPALLLRASVHRLKVLTFHTDTRPAYKGTWVRANAARRLAASRRAAADTEAAPEAWDPKLEAAAGAGEGAGAGAGTGGEDEGVKAAPYCDITNRGRLSSRNPRGVAPSVFDYEVDSEGEWEVQDEGDDVDDLERESAGSEEEDEEGVKVDDGLDYEDGWLCADDVVIVDAGAIAREKEARKAAAGAGDGVGEGGAIPGLDDMDEDCVSDEEKEGAGRGRFNPAAMPGASSAHLASLGASGGADPSTSSSAPKRRRILMPGAGGGRTSILDTKSFVFGVCYDLEAFLAGAVSDLARAAGDLLAGRVEGVAPVRALVPPAMTMHTEEEVAAGGAEDEGGEAPPKAAKEAKGPSEPKAPKPAKEVKEKAVFPPALLPSLVRMVHGSQAGAGKIVDSFVSHEAVLAHYAVDVPPAAEGAPPAPPPTIPRSLVTKMIGEIAVKGRYGYDAPRTKAGAEESGHAEAAASPAPVTAVAPVSKERETSFVPIDLAPWVRAVMAAEGRGALNKAYTLLRFVVTPAALEAAAFALAPDVEAAAAVVTKHVADKEARLGSAPGKTAVPSYSSILQEIEAIARVAAAPSPSTVVAAAGLKAKAAVPANASAAPAAAGSRKRKIPEEKTAAAPTTGSAKSKGTPGSAAAGAGPAKKARTPEAGKGNILAMFASPVPLATAAVVEEPEVAGEAGP